MLSPKRSVFKEPLIVPLPTLQAPVVRKIHNAFPIIWSALVFGTVVMAGVIYASLQTVRLDGATGSPLRTPLPAAQHADEHLYHSGDTVCVIAGHSPTGSSVAYTMPVSAAALASNNGVTVAFSVAAGEPLRVLSPKPYVVDGYTWLAVSNSARQHGYAPTAAFTECTSPLATVTAGAPANSAAPSAAASDTLHEDTDTMARTLAMEYRLRMPESVSTASDEPLSDSELALLQAMAWTILNRARDAASRWPKSITGVCVQRGQYVWNEQMIIHNRPTSALGGTSTPFALAVAAGNSPLPHVSAGDRAYRVALDVARRCVVGELTDNTRGAQFAYPLNPPPPHPPVPDALRSYTATATSVAPPQMSVPSYVHPYANNAGFAGFAGSNNNTPASGGKFPPNMSANSRPGSTASMPGLTAPLPLTPSSHGPAAAAAAAVAAPVIPMPTSRECVVKVLSCVIGHLFPPVYELEKSGECKYFDAHFTPSLSPQQYYSRLAEYSGVSGEVLMMTLYHLNALYPFSNLVPGATPANQSPFLPNINNSTNMRGVTGFNQSMYQYTQPGRAEVRTSALRLSSLNFHRIFLASLLVSTKYFDDHFLSNASFAKLGGIAVNELNAMESQFLALTGFSLYISPQSYKNFYLFLSTLPFHSPLPAQQPQYPIERQMMAQAQAATGSGQSNSPVPGAAAGSTSTGTGSGTSSPMSPLRSLLASVHVSSPAGTPVANGSTPRKASSHGTMTTSASQSSLQSQQAAAAQQQQMATVTPAAFNLPAGANQHHASGWPQQLQQQPCTCQCAPHLPFFAAYASQLDAVNIHTYAPPTACPPCVLIPLKASRMVSSTPSSPATQFRTIANRVAQPVAPNSASRTVPGVPALPPIVNPQQQAQQPQAGMGMGTMHVPAHLATAKPTGPSTGTGVSAFVAPAPVQSRPGSASAGGGSMPPQLVPMQTGAPDGAQKPTISIKGPSGGGGGGGGGDNLARAVLMRSFLSKQQAPGPAQSTRTPVSAGVSGGGRSATQSPLAPVTYAGQTPTSAGVTSSAAGASGGGAYPGAFAGGSDVTMGGTNSPAMPAQVPAQQHQHHHPQHNQETTAALIAAATAAASQPLRQPVVTNTAAAAAAAVAAPTSSAAAAAAAVSAPSSSTAAQNAQLMNTVVTPTSHLRRLTPSSRATAAANNAASMMY